MSLVAAKCTQCGAELEVDNTQEAAVCKYCGTPFIVEKAINNINIKNATFNIEGQNVDNLIIRAKQYEDIGDREKALEYYNKALDIDVANSDAIAGIERLTCYLIGTVKVTRKDMLRIDSALKNNNELEAIRILRELTGWGLAEAKEFLEKCYHVGASPEDVFQMTSAYKNNKIRSSGGCYIATAVYGSYDCPQVWTLRRYRDIKLASTWYGRIFISLYYAISPTLVEWLGDSAWFKKLWRKYLDSKITELKLQGFEDLPYIDEYC